MRRVALFAAVTLLLGLVVPNVVASAAGVAGPELSPVQQAKIALGGGYLPLHPEEYARAKAAADAKAGLPVAPDTRTIRRPGIFRSWEGPFDPSLTPGDNTGAIGPTRYITLVNAEFAIYDRVNDLPLSTGTLKDLAGAPPSDFVFDPQIMWDPGTRRFYYAMDDIVSGADNRIAWGFSKTANPTTSADFCKYRTGFGYGSDFPDYPKLGDTRQLLLIGVNTFAGGFAYIGSDVIFVTKPPAGPNCPAEGAFTTGVKKALRNEDGSLTSTPQPAQQTDDDRVGWILGTEDVSGGGSSNYISVFAVRRSPGGAVQFSPAHSVTIPNYSLPPSAPQLGTTATLDTLDGRLLHAVSAIDPANGNEVGVWTAHAVAGGAGSESRWYEIDPLPVNNPTLFQSGEASHATLYTWNPAISPDRACTLAACTFGQSMVMGFSTSAPSAFPAAQMVSKIGAGAQSAFVMVKQSPGFNRDFSCSPCRWGDYSGATPDPTPPPGPTGAVWLTNQWNVASINNTDVDWRTWNWAATP
jgi:hypothetical protein